MTTDLQETFEWTPEGLVLLRTIQSEIDHNGGTDQTSIRIMAEWPKIYYGEIKNTFIGLLKYYTMKELSDMFGITYAQAVSIRKRLNGKIERIKLTRPAKRHINKLLKPLFHPLTGVYFDTITEAALAFNIPLGSMAYKIEHSDKFVKVYEDHPRDK